MALRVRPIFRTDFTLNLKFCFVVLRSYELNMSGCDDIPRDVRGERAATKKVFVVCVGIAYSRDLWSRERLGPYSQTNIIPARCFRS